MADVLNITVEIYRKETEISGTMTKPYKTTLVLKEGDEVRFIIAKEKEGV